jgi:hypothetical protein
MNFASRLVLVLAVSFVLSAESPPWSWKTALHEAAEWVKEKTGLDRCKYVASPSVQVNKKLSSVIKGQRGAVDSITGALQSWEFSRGSSSAAPLILAITGPTGTGKTETANLISEAIFRRQESVDSGSHLTVSEGLLIFRGEDFSDNVTQPISRYHEEIKIRLSSHLSKCSGRAVVVFDEVQKVIPGTLDVLLQAMSERPTLTYFQPGQAEAKNIDCSNVIFILISDIGVNQILKVLLRHKHRHEVPHAKLRNVVKEALDRQWKRLNFGKVINEVVPFLPFEPQQIEEIIELKLHRLSQQHALLKWAHLCTTKELHQYLSRPQSKFIIYNNHTDKKLGGSKLYSKYGARNVENGGPLQHLKGKLFRHLKPWQKDKAVHIRFDEQTQHVKIYRCPVPKVDPREGGGEGGDREGQQDASGGEGASGTCDVAEGSCSDAAKALSCNQDVESSAGCDLVWGGELK